jgi:4-carboxymuconolactone decarboxylase
VTAPGEPRLEPIPFAEWDETTRATLLRFLRRPEVYLSGALDAPPMPIVLEMFAHHLALSVSWLPFTEMLASDDAMLRPEHRELLILRVAWRTRSGYEWNQHSRMGADAGLTPAQTEAIAEGPSAEVWTPVERALLAAVDEIVDDHVIGDATWRALASHFGSAELFELLFVIGGYLCLAGALNSIGLQGTMPSGPPTSPGSPGAGAAGAGAAGAGTAGAGATEDAAP